MFDSIIIIQTTVFQNDVNIREKYWYFEILHSFWFQKIIILYFNLLKFKNGIKLKFKIQKKSKDSILSWTLF